MRSPAGKARLRIAMFFSLTLPPGEYPLACFYIGYESCSFNFTELDRMAYIQY